MRVCVGKLRNVMNLMGTLIEREVGKLRISGQIVKKEIKFYKE